MDTFDARWGAAAVAVAPTVMAAGLFAHPLLGNPKDAGFLAALEGAVVADTFRWAVVHLAIAVASGLMILAFLALRSYLRSAGGDRWSAVGVPFVVMGSLLFALLPAFEFAPVAAAGAGADIQATQAVLQPWLMSTQLTSGVLFLLGTLAFVKGLTQRRVMGRASTTVVASALTVMALTRLLPPGVVLLYVGPIAGLVALWPLAYAMWKRPDGRSDAASPRIATT